MILAYALLGCILFVSAGAFMALCHKLKED